MKMVISNTKLTLLAISILLATMSVGWLLGRAARDDASETVIRSQNQIINTYAYQVGSLQTELQKKNITLDTQKSSIWYNDKQIADFKTVQVEILRELRALKAEIKKAGTAKPFLPDNSFFLDDMVLIDRMNN
jgi:peptidoglycan hydrolase CwlO-like protein